MRPVLLLLSTAFAATVACAGNGREGQIACQQRLVDVGSGPIGPGGMGPGFARLSHSYAQLSLVGCSDDQRYRTRAMARVAAALAATADRIGDPVRRMEREPGLRGSRDYLELQSLLEQFEGRRRALREDLSRMMGRGEATR